MDFDSVCLTLESDVRWLHSRYAHLRLAFECDTTKTLMGDVSLAAAQRMLVELTDKVNGIISAREAMVGREQDVA